MNRAERRAAARAGIRAGDDPLGRAEIGAPAPRLLQVWAVAPNVELRIVIGGRTGTFDLPPHQAEDLARQLTEAAAMVRAHGKRGG